MAGKEGEGQSLASERKPRSNCALWSTTLFPPVNVLEICPLQPFRILPSHRTQPGPDPDPIPDVAQEEAY